MLLGGWMGGWMDGWVGEWMDDRSLFSGGSDR